MAPRFMVTNYELRDETPFGPYDGTNHRFTRGPKSASLTISLEGDLSAVEAFLAAALKETKVKSK